MRRLILFSLLLVACSNGDTWQRLQQTGTLRIGLDPTYPPFENADSGELVGIDVDLARMISADLALSPQFVYIGYDGLYDALLTQRVDLLISALVIDESRSADFAFSDPYFNAGQLLLTPIDSPIQQLSDLANRSVAVELGAMGHVAAIEQQKRVDNLQIIPLQSPDEVIAAVENGSADAAIIDNITAQLAHSPRLKIADPAVTVEPFVIVVRVEDKILRNQINDSLEKLEESGELQRLLERGFGR
jgi:polar amino acid transport system substrate-binding protein